MAENYEKQKQFVTDANHELKTPLTLILSNVDIIEEETGKNEWLEDIRLEGQRMSRLVEQLVALSRVDEDSFEVSNQSSVLVFCAVIGVIFGGYPAMKASKLQPIEALRI